MNDPDRNSVNRNKRINDRNIEQRERGGLTGKKRGLDNIVVAISKPKRGGNSSDDLLKEQCPYQPLHKHSAAECQQLRNRGLTLKTNKGKGKKQSQQQSQRSRRRVPASEKHDQSNLRWHSSIDLQEESQANS